MGHSVSGGGRGPVTFKNKMEGEGPDSKVLKVVIIGDGAVGKTALMVRYRDGKFPLDYIPTVFEMNAKTVEVDDEQFELRLWDTAGQEAYEELRKQAYIGADVIIIGFCLVNRDSFENVTELWQKDYAKEAKDAKVVLVGLKQDLVEDATELKKLSEKNQEPVTEEEMANVAKKVGASSHLRCSALTGDGVNELGRLPFNQPLTASLSLLLRDDSIRFLKK